MRSFICSCVLLCVVNVLYAQVLVTGKITDNRNNPLQGVSVTIVDSYDGTTSDSLGNYQFTTTEKGERKLSATATGYKTFEVVIKLENSPVTVNIGLKENISELKAVIISAGAFLAGDTKKATALTSLDIATTANANADITGAIRTLPGTVQVGEKEGLFVRGGTAGETKYFIDGSLVNNFFYTSEPGIASRGRFNPFLFSGTIFSSGGYSALYGQALSSVLLLESIDLPDKTSADFGLSFLSANAGFQKLAGNKKSSWGATYAYANLGLVFDVIKQKYDYNRVPVAHQGDWNYRHKTKGGIIKYYGMISQSNLAFKNSDIDTPAMKDAFSLNSFNMYHNLSWKQNMGKGWRLRLSTSYAFDQDKIKMELQDANGKKQIIADDLLYANKNFELRNQSNYFNSKIVIEKNLHNLSAIRFGAEENYSKEEQEFTDFSGNIYHEDVLENIVSGFAEADIYITNNLAIKGGLRTEHSQLLQKMNIAPRLSLAYQFKNKSQVSLAHGIFYQNPESKYLPSLNALHFQKATHYIAQYQKLSKDYTFRLEAYYKEYDDLIKTKNFAKETAINNEGFGDAKGIELFWRDRKSIKNFDYWLSYSYLDTKRDFLNYPFMLRPDFSSKHTASLVMKKFVLPIKTQFNASYTFATGRPYYNMIYDRDGKIVIKEQGNAGNYNDLSLSVNYVPSVGNPKAKAFTVVVLSLTNVLGANNIYSYQFSANGENKVAVTPPAKRFFYLGCFISLGVDRTEDAINNHL